MRTLLLLLCCITAVCSAETELGRAQQQLLTQAQTALQENQADKALAHLSGWKGEDHALQQYLLGYAYRIKLNSEAAALAFQRCLELDPERKDAALLLIDLYAETDRWQEARPLILQWIDIDADRLPLIKIMVYCAQALEDFRWTEALLQRALLRFPDDQDLRRLDAGLLIERQQWQEAQTAVEHLLQSAGSDARLWRYLSVIYHSQGKQESALAASEAALLLSPEDNALRLEHGRGQLAAGHTGEALKQAQLLMQQENVNNSIIHFALQSALAFGDMDLAQAYVAQLDPEYRKTDAQALSLQVYMHHKQYEKLDAMVDQLLAEQALDEKLQLWLAVNAEERDLFGRAEMLYQLVRQGKGSNAQMATLYLARLWHRQHRSTDAQSLVTTHLRQYPEDEHARRLLTLISE